MRVFPQSLPKSQFAVALFQAGRYGAAREHWLLQAKGCVEGRSFYVSLAKSSHRAYMNALQLVTELANRRKAA